MIEFIKKLFQCFFNWLEKPAETEQLKNIDVSIVPAFGGKDEDGPGKSNMFLVNTTQKLSKEYGKPIIAQWEIADQLLLNQTITTIRNSRVKGKYLDTYEVAAQAHETCKEKSFTTIALIAHPDHAWRCKKTLEKLGLKVFVVNTAGCPYDPQSNQIWTRSRNLFIPREILARLMYLTKGYI